ncbi:MAG: ribulose-phosphate 3-epimerase [Saprospiraceae bacterium]
MSHFVAPSILSADFGNLESDIAMINDSKADWIHVDIMDGLFVPNISFGPDILNVIRKHTKLPLDVHLMITDPDRYLDVFHTAGADHITVHVEACSHLHRTIQKIKSLGLKAGVALNPHTPVQAIEDVLEDLDIIILMSVNPGFGGQTFIYRTIDKIARLKTMIIERNANALIEIDGGVGLQNAERILQAGADVLVAGNSVFKSENPSLAIYSLKNLGIKTLYA